MIRFLLDQSKKEPEKYNKFFEDYSLFMREGIITTQEQDVKVLGIVQILETVQQHFSFGFQAKAAKVSSAGNWLSALVPVQEDIAKLLRFESSALPAGQQTNLSEYASRMKAGTRNIYYLCSPTRHLAEHSPYYEAMKQKDMEVSCGHIMILTVELLKKLLWRDAR